MSQAQNKWLVRSKIWNVTLFPAFSGWAEKTYPGMIPCLRQAYERRLYKVPPSLISWAQT